MTEQQLILASSSPQRKQLLAEAGFEFQIVPPRDEAEGGICSNCGPAELVLDLAQRKAADVVQQLSERQSPGKPTLVIACDTVAECGGMVLGKPTDEPHARSMLQRLRGTRHRVYSGLCLWSLTPAAQVPPLVRLATTELQMDPIPDAELEEYLATGLWQSKAGAFGLQDRPGWLHIVSGSKSNVIGLPLELLAEMLSELQEPPTEPRP